MKINDAGINTAIRRGKLHPAKQSIIPLRQVLILFYPFMERNYPKADQESRYVGLSFGM